MLSIDELEYIVDEITSKIYLANRNGELEELLEAWGLANLIEKESVYETRKDGKILVIGESDVKVDKLIGVIKALGLRKERFEFCLEYSKAKTYQYNKLQYNPNYRAVLFGPVPHSSVGKNESGSVIAEMQSKEGYPRVELLSSNNALKITKSNFTEKLQELMQKDYI